MSEKKDPGSKSLELNLRRYDDELESSIGAIFDSIDFSSIEKHADDEIRENKDSHEGIPSTQYSPTPNSYDDDGMEDAIDNALNDVFDFKTEATERIATDEEHHRGDEEKTLQSALVSESLSNNVSAEGDLSARAVESSVPTGSENQDLDDAIDSAFDNLLRDPKPSHDEGSHKAALQEEVDRNRGDDTALTLEIMETGAQTQEQNDLVENHSAGQNDDLKHDISDSSYGGRDGEGQEQQKTDASSTTGPVNGDDPDDELDFAIRNALGNIFEKQTQEITTHSTSPPAADLGKGERHGSDVSATSKMKHGSSLQDEPKIISHIRLYADHDDTKTLTNVVFEGTNKRSKSKLTQVPKDSTTIPDDNLDENLRGIIGQAFDEIFGKESSNANYSNEVLQPQAHKKTKSNITTNHKNYESRGMGPTLSHAIQNTATDLLRQHKSIDGTHSTTSFGVQNYKQDEDQSLVDAIGAAFRSIEESSSKNRSSTFHEDFEHHPTADDVVFEGRNDDKNYASKSHKQTGDEKAATDQDIVDAIADAFKSAMLAEHDMRNYKTNKDESFHEPQLKFRKKSVKTLANEITQQVQYRFKDEQKARESMQVAGTFNVKPIPAVHSQKDDVLLRLDSQESNIKLRTAITSAVKSAVGAEKEDEIVDIEELQMNDILQNAIKMASENPQELISNLEIDQVISVDDKGRSKILEEPHKANLTGLGARHRVRPSKPAKDQLRVPPSLEDKSKSSLSSETKNGNNEQFDFSSGLISKEDAAKNSLLSNPDIKSQISSVMSSLTSKINSGELADTNILFTIRQITEELASGGSLANFLSNQTPLDEVISGNEEADRKALANALGMARHFLLDFPSESHVEEKSVDEINTMISNLNEDFSSTTLLLSNERAEFISSIANSTLTALVDNITDIKYSVEVFDDVEKFRNTSPEARRRTRVGNRERKKKWREENAERNRDIELRTRVLKKALAEFGEEDTSSKLEWIESEIKRRKARRHARSQADDDKTEEAAKVENTKLQDVNEKAQQVAQDKRLISQVKDVLKIFFERPDHLKTSSQLITVSSVLGALSLIYSETIKLDEDVMLAGMKSILKTITDRVHILDGHRSRLSQALLRTESSKRRLSEILLNAKRLKVDPSLLASFQDSVPQSLRVADGIVSKPSLQLPRTSPFISHKVGSNAGASTTGLRKPGSFQKPKAFERPGKDKNRGGGLDSPKVSSTT